MGDLSISLQLGGKSNIPCLPQAACPCLLPALVPGMLPLPCTNAIHKQCRNCSLASTASTWAGGPSPLSGMPGRILCCAGWQHMYGLQTSLIQPVHSSLGGPFKTPYIR